MTKYLWMHIALAGVNMILSAISATIEIVLLVLLDNFKHEDSNPVQFSKLYNNFFILCLILDIGAAIVSALSLYPWILVAYLPLILIKGMKLVAQTWRTNPTVIRMRNIREKKEKATVYRIAFYCIMFVVWIVVFIFSVMARYKLAEKDLRRYN
ncbi:hypothetical protein BLNAU_17307 [Blattamonas nauphoetae]|uniref:Cornichon n=1 Tax=Blattamonas nauphoetae TaxID=2049346 RepID=A0ABQ9X7Q7_9EUKA|nr:hypothetical protein BLNAU_17307 [Blattamonas nauphoetae]